MKCNFHAVSRHATVSPRRHRALIYLAISHTDHIAQFHEDLTYFGLKPSNSRRRQFSSDDSAVKKDKDGKESDTAAFF